MTRKQKTVVYGANRPIAISISDKHWDVLFAITRMEGTPIEEYVRGIVEFGIRDAAMDEGYLGRMLSKGFLETLGNDGKQ